MHSHVRSIYALLALALAPPARAAASRPDVLLLTIDTLRPDYLSVNAYACSTSPALDSLITASWYFEDAATPIARTTPALASLLTGAYPHGSGVRALWENMPPDVITWPQLLQRAGWQSFAVVTNTVLTAERGLNRGFDVYKPAGDARTARATTDRALECLASARKDRPLFAWVHYIDPHMPYRSDPKIIQRFDGVYHGRYELGFGEARQPGDTSDPFP